MSFEQKQYWLKGRQHEKERICALIQLDKYIYDVEKRYLIELIRGTNANFLGDNLPKTDHAPDVEEEIMIDISSTNRHNDRYSEHYTPTTEEVRSYYRPSSDTCGAEFDRWLTQVKADAWDEGWRDGIVVPYSLGNPYRKKKEQP